METVDLVFINEMSHSVGNVVLIYLQHSRPSYKPIKNTRAGSINFEWSDNPKSL